MAQRSHVPKFGNWESEENVPYTAYFDKARKDKTGTRIINPNDPQENPDLLHENSSSMPNSEEHIRKGTVRSKHESEKSREDNGFRNYMKSPAQNENIANDFPNQRPGSRGVGSAENYRRVPKQSVGSEQSIERSPLHRKAAAAGVSSPSWEGKNSYDGNHGTPGRSRLRPSTRGDETPDRGAAVPKFGEWDESNPSSADGFTYIFNKVREERQGGVVSSPSRPSKASYPARKQSTSDSVLCCCFGMGGK